MITCLQSGDTLEIICTGSEKNDLLANLAPVFHQYPDVNTVKFFVDGKLSSVIPLNLVLSTRSIDAPGACFKVVDRRVQTIEYWEDIAVR